MKYGDILKESFLAHFFVESRQGTMRSSRSTKTKVYILQTTYSDNSIIIYCSLYFT